MKLARNDILQNYFVIESSSTDDRYVDNEFVFNEVGERRAMRALFGLACRRVPGRFGCHVVFRHRHPVQRAKDHLLHRFRCRRTWHRIFRRPSLVNPESDTREARMLLARANEHRSKSKFDLMSIIIRLEEIVVIVFCLVWLKGCSTKCANEARGVKRDQTFAKSIESEPTTTPADTSGVHAVH